METITNTMMKTSTRLNFLNAALTDMSACIRFMDTKVATIIAADMVMLTTLITSDNINRITALLISFLEQDSKHRCFSNVFCDFNNVLFNIALVIALICFSCCTICIYGIGISTLFARLGTKGSSNRSTRFVTDDSYKIEDYLSDFEGKTTEDLIKEMAEELYELNKINRTKMKHVNITLTAFGLSLVSVSVIIFLFIIAKACGVKLF